MATETNGSERKGGGWLTFLLRPRGPATLRRRRTWPTSPAHARRHLHVSAQKQRRAASICTPWPSVLHVPSESGVVDQSRQNASAAASSDSIRPEERRAVSCAAALWSAQTRCSGRRPRTCTAPARTQPPPLRQTGLVKRNARMKRADGPALVTEHGSELVDGAVVDVAGRVRKLRLPLRRGRCGLRVSQVAVLLLRLRLRPAPFPQPRPVSPAPHTSQARHGAALAPHHTPHAPQRVAHFSPHPYRNPASRTASERTCALRLAS